MAYIAALQPAILQEGAAADIQRLNEIFYQGVNARMDSQPDPFEKALIYFTAHPFFIPVGNMADKLDKVLKMKETNELFQLSPSPNMKAVLKKGSFDYTTNSMLLNLAHAGYLMITTLQKPIADFEEYQELTEEVRRLLDLAVFAASSLTEGQRTKQMTQVICSQADRFVKRFAEMYGFSIPLN
ncbi:hypothetical protein HYX05_03590 [Candidatus Woesearchaeota archaeon]|nr:hypothetical protein [Candidatus Woesearchaeota archaeon]